MCYFMRILSIIVALHVATGHSSHGNEGNHAVSLNSCDIRCGGGGAAQPDVSTVIGRPGKVGPKGDFGEKGSKGQTGVAGQEGSKGEKGSKGDEGSKGNEGSKGQTGVAGQEGSKGEKGSKGDEGSKVQTGAKGQPAEVCVCTDMSSLMQELEQLRGALQSKSCRDVIPRYREDEGGVYTIFPFSGGKSGIEVYCDLMTDGGGWIVFQKRVDGSEDFERNWNDYVNGFGKLDGEFWLGLETLHRLTAAGDYEMRIDFEDFDGAKHYSKFESVEISAGDDYSIALTGYTGDAGNGLANGAKFSTVDKDQDTYAGNCAAMYPGGWWFAACHSGNLNGLYLRGEHESYANGVGWGPLRGLHYSLKKAEMKIRKRL